jgi:hypothetical protein
MAEPDTQSPTSAASAAAEPTGGGRVDPLPRFDAHMHYSEDAWPGRSPEEALAIMRRAGIVRALVSSTPDDGTLRLHRLAPDLVVPVLRPYRTRSDLATWTRDPSVVPYLESRYRRGIHRGIGEFHLSAGETASPVVRAVVSLAARERLFLHCHCDERAVEELLVLSGGVTVLWAHAGMTASAAVVAGLLDRHASLNVELALRSDVAPAGALDPAWRALFVRHPGRFLLGTDTWTPGRWGVVEEVARSDRAWLAQLPREVAEAIAHENGMRLVGRD